MKIHIETYEELEDEEIIIRCLGISDEVKKIQSALEDIISKKNKIAFSKGIKEYFFPVEDVLFFETDDDAVNAHTDKDIFKVKYRLYELEEDLPGFFVRISKSTIINTKKVMAVEKNISSSSIVSFFKSHKQVYVSRRYYKILKERLEKRG